LNLSDLSSVRPLDRTYAHPRPDYNPNSPRFHRVICRTWCRKPAKSKSQSSAPGLASLALRPPTAGVDGSC
jgi:hypothetical protein